MLKATEKKSPLVRYAENPILKADPANAWEDLCVLNPAVIYDEKRKKFVMLYRAAGHDVEHRIYFGLAESEDGFHFERVSAQPALSPNPDDADGGCLEDPRLVQIDGVYYVVYAARAYAPGRYWLSDEEYEKLGYRPETTPASAPYFQHKNNTVSYLAATKDFKRWKRLGRITDARFDDRDVLIFPERVNGKFVRISRPKIPGAPVKMPSVWITFSDDLLEWGEPKVLFTGEQWWETARIGAGCPPIKHKKGWFMLYHGVDGAVGNLGTYRVGAVMLDLNDPSKVIARTKNFLMEPKEPFETEGLYGDCVFPTGNVLKDGTLYIYYGCADKYVAVVTADFDELVDAVFEG
ncbi:MAG: hypothetical protein LBH24_06695 [Clostridiales bacterium]|nr:hypothetical protein [Clostridiales bacterium]